MKTDTGVLHVQPTGSLDDSRIILNLRLGPFEVREEPLSMASGWFLRPRVRHILEPRPPGTGQAGSIGSGRGGERQVTFKADNPALREALDGLALAAGQTNWVVTYPEYETAPGRFRETITRDGERVREDQQPVWQFVPWDSKSR